MNVDYHLCASLKDRGKWTPTICNFCRNRKKCKFNDDQKELMQVNEGGE